MEEEIEELKYKLELETTANYRLMKENEQLKRELEQLKQESGEQYENVN